MKIINVQNVMQKKKKKLVNMIIKKKMIKNTIGKNAQNVELLKKTAKKNINLTRL